MDEYLFDRVVATNVDGTSHGLGKLVIPRTTFIRELCDMILAFAPIHNSHYFRGPMGTGKSCNLTLICKELSNPERHCKVYYFPNLQFMMSPQAFKQLKLNETIETNNAAGLRTVMVIDEAHSSENPLWSVLLKDHHKLVVIAAGVPPVGKSMRNFNKKHDPKDLMFRSNNEEDMECVVSSICKAQSVELTSDNHDELLAMCKWVCDYTSGHSYPFLQFFAWGIQQGFYATGFKMHFQCSSFLDSSICASVNSRCELDKLSADFFTLLLERLHVKEDIDRLDEFGYYDPVTKFIISRYLCSLVYRVINTTKTINKPRIDGWDTMPVLELAKTIICAGLYCMDPNDFEEHFIKGNVKYDRIENAIGWIWSTSVASAISNLYISPQPECGTGWIDFVFNGKNPLAIDVCRNSYGLGDPEDPDDKLTKFELGIYREWRHKFAILNIQLKDPQAALHTDDRVFTFHKPTNTLYQGVTLITNNAVLKLQSLPLEKLVASEEPVTLSDMELHAYNKDIKSSTVRIDSVVKVPNLFHGASLNLESCSKPGVLYYDFPPRSQLWTGYMYPNIFFKYVENGPAKKEIPLTFALNCVNILNEGKLDKNVKDIIYVTATPFPKVLKNEQAFLSDTGSVRRNKLPQETQSKLGVFKQRYGSVARTVASKIVLSKKYSTCVRPITCVNIPFNYPFFIGLVRRLMK